MIPPVCDFCSSPDVQWSYPARSFRHERHLTAYAVDLTDASIESQNIDLTAGSIGNWAACPACHALIERQDRKRLVLRSAKRMLRKHPMQMTLRTAMDLIRPLQDQFWDNRTGQPTRFEL